MKFSKVLLGVVAFMFAVSIIACKGDVKPTTDNKSKTEQTDSTTHDDGDHKSCAADCKKPCCAKKDAKSCCASKGDHKCSADSAKCAAIMKACADSCGTDSGKVCSSHEKKCCAKKDTTEN